MTICISPTFSPGYTYSLDFSGFSLVRAHDPKENYKVVFSSPDYDQVRLWLLEDEYIRIEGRNELSRETG